jgi:hypothetical protein
MTEQTPVPDLKPLSRYEVRRQRRGQRHPEPSRADAWSVGIILIILGGLFLIRTSGTVAIPLTNWWALFILLPAFGALTAAWRMYAEADNQLTAAARSSLLVGLVLTFVTFMLLFEISWTYVGPILIILVGIAIILNYVIGNQG